MAKFGLNTVDLSYDLWRVALLIFCVLRRFGLYGVLYTLGGAKRSPPAGRALRALFEDMGAAYIKFGQYLAMRYDLLTPETCSELSHLMDRVPSIEFERVRRSIECELGAPLAALFLDFDPQPLASASIAQVHSAVARDGMKLAVKVQRPGIQRRLLADLRNLTRAARVAHWLGLGRGIPFLRIAEELSEFTLREIDFMAEADTADRVRRESPGFVRVPRIRWDLTTQRILCMELVDGVSLLAVCQLAESGHPDAFGVLLPGVDPTQVVSMLARACLTQEYVTGKFHGDPHPANIIVCPDGRIAFIDFGIFGHLTRDQRRLLAQYTGALTAGQFSRAFRFFGELITFGPDTDVRLFRKDTIGVMQRWFALASQPDAPRQDKVGARFQFEMLSLMRQHGVQINPNQVLFWRTQHVLDATALRLPVEFHLPRFVAGFLSSPAVVDALGLPSADNLSIPISLSSLVQSTSPSVLPSPTALRVQLRVISNPLRESEAAHNSDARALAAFLVLLGPALVIGALLPNAFALSSSVLLVLLVLCMRRH